MIDRILPSLPEGRVWVAADEVYGRDGAFRVFLEEHRLPYAVTVPASQTVLPRPGWRHIARLVQRVASEEDWVELPAGPSQAGTQTWQWWVRRVPDPDGEVGRGAWARWIIARRRPGEPQEQDYFFAYEIRRLLVLTQPQIAYTEQLRRGLTWRRCHQAVDTVAPRLPLAQLPMSAHRQSSQLPLGDTSDPATN